MRRQDAPPSPQREREFYVTPGQRQLHQRAEERLASEHEDEPMTFERSISVESVSERSQTRNIEGNVLFNDTLGTFLFKVTL